MKSVGAKLFSLYGVTMLVISTACSEKDNGISKPFDSGGEGGGTPAGGQGGATSGGSGGVGGRASQSCNGVTYTGDATFYKSADGSGKCMFNPTPNDLLITAINHVNYGDAASCGACVEVAGRDGKVTVRVVDYIGSSSPEGNLDLSPEAFERLAPLARGRIPISWEYVPCEVSGPIVYHFKDGSTAEWWTAVQVRNHRHAVASVEYRDETGTYRAMERTSYNYFVADDGVGNSSIGFRVTDVHGQRLTDEGVEHVEDGDIAGSGQFPPCE